MILDKLLLQNTSSIGKSLLQKAGLESTPKNINEMHLFLEATKKSIESNEFEGALLGNILFSFVSSTEVRDRNVTSRVFEDIFAGLFNEKCTDKTQRSNPSVIQDILNLDTLCKNEDWLISTDLAGNKREKSDLELGNYSISLKTLKGKVYDINDNIIPYLMDMDYRVVCLELATETQGISMARLFGGTYEMLQRDILSKRYSVEEYKYRLDAYLSVNKITEKEYEELGDMLNE